MPKNNWSWTRKAAKPKAKEAPPPVEPVAAMEPFVAVEPQGVEPQGVEPVAAMEPFVETEAVVPAFVCKMCGSEFDSPHRLGRHVTRWHGGAAS